MTWLSPPIFLLYHVRRKTVLFSIAHPLIDDVLEALEIERSLSNKGNPYDNAVSEAVNKIMKTEFIYQNKFDTLEELQLKLAEYVYWYNNLRVHGSLGYLTPLEYRVLSTLKLAG